MKARRIVALVIGGLFVLPALGVLLGGAAVTLVYAFGRDDDGYFDATLDEFESDTVAISVGEELLDEPGPPDWLFDLLDAEIRIRVTNGDPDSPVFVGIARDVNIANYLEGVEHDRMTGLDGRMPELTLDSGTAEVTPPGEEEFWVTSAEGVGTQEIEWEVEGGNWGAVLMNADGAAGISAEVNFGAKSGFVLPLGVGLLIVGLLSVTGTVLLIVYGIRGLGAEKQPPPEGLEAGPEAVPEQVPAEDVPSEEAPSAGAPALEAVLDPDLSRWQWLVKWFLAIPHFIVLLFLWVAFMVLTLIAGFAILFTGRYPRGMFDFNVGVMRWTWRVSYYAASGGLGTDRYPAFSLQPDPDYPAALDVPYPERLSRGLVLVKWWLLAIPHYLIVGVFVGSTYYWVVDDGGDWIWVSCGGLIGVLVLIAAIGLLFTDRYPRGLFDMIVGLNRWVFRVAVYSLLMTDDYPPFRLDQGGNDPARSRPASREPA